MNAEYKEVITRTMEYGGILDAMLTLQEKDGYLTRRLSKRLRKNLICSLPKCMILQVFTA